MPHTIWSAKRLRQFGKLKEKVNKSVHQQSFTTEIASDSVNKNRQDLTSARLEKVARRRSGPGSHSGPLGRSYAQLYEEARRRNIRGRSGMNKAELEQALDAGKRGGR
ncbi:hypothetical protein UNDKW_3589 [Undibacterium sp. KW1]|nr:hypothetical protein UNDKW_3589 [Undibacterium sp. KW1]